MRVLHGQTLVELHRVSAGRAEIERGLADLVAASSPDEPLVLQARVALADALEREGRAKEALPQIAPIYDKFIALIPSAEDAGPPKLVYAKALAAAGDRKKARAILAEVIAAWAGKRTWQRELADARKLAKQLR
jgi:hypothetical protein